MLPTAGKKLSIMHLYDDFKNVIVELFAERLHFAVYQKQLTLVDTQYQILYTY